MDIAGFSNNMQCPLEPALAGLALSKELTGRIVDRVWGLNEQLKYIVSRPYRSTFRCFQVVLRFSKQQKKDYWRAEYFPSHIYREPRLRAGLTAANANERLCELPNPNNYKRVDVTHIKGKLEVIVDMYL